MSWGESFADPPAGVDLPGVSCGISFALLPRAGKKRRLLEKGDAMIATLELDKQTASFVRQLEEQRKLEKALLVERVRGTKEGPESVFSEIKSRVAMLERLNGTASASCIAPIGWSKLIFTGADSVSAPNTIGFGDRDETLCKLDQIRYLDETTYLQLSVNPHYVEHVMPNKSAHARAGANPALWDTLGSVHVGYVTQLAIPASLEPTTVSIMSRLNTLFNWVEANAVGDEWYAQVSATALVGDIRRGVPADAARVVRQSVGDAEADADAPGHRLVRPQRRVDDAGLGLRRQRDDDQCL
jgi:hypothetical protein